MGALKNLLKLNVLLLWYWDICRKCAIKIGIISVGWFLFGKDMKSSLLAFLGTECKNGSVQNPGHLAELSFT